MSTIRVAELVRVAPALPSIAICHAFNTALAEAGG